MSTSPNGRHCTPAGSPIGDVEVVTICQCRWYVDNSVPVNGRKCRKFFIVEMGRCLIWLRELMAAVGLTHVKPETNHSLMREYLAVALTVAVIAVLCQSCGDDGSEDQSSETPSVSANASESPTPTPSVNLVPPFEGPDRGPAATERTDFRDVPEWELPEPDALPTVPDDETDAIFFPPDTVECADDWVLIQRPSEGFTICHPPDWQTAGDGYVSAGVEDRWYSHGLFKFSDEARSQPEAHVSIYAIPRFARPMVYTRDCPRPYGLTFAGEAAVICPEFPEESPQEDFVSYHVRKGDYDYFINIVPYEMGDDEVFDLAVDIAHTFQLTEISTP